MIVNQRDSVFKVCTAPEERTKPITKTPRYNWNEHRLSERLVLYRQQNKAILNSLSLKRESKKTLYNLQPLV